MLNFQDRHGITFVALRDRKMVLTKHTSDMSRCLFQAELSETDVTVLFAELAKAKLGLESPEDFSAVRDVVASHPELIGSDPELIGKVLACHKDAVIAFVESELSAYEIRNLAYRKSQLEVMRRLLTESEYFDEVRRERCDSLGLKLYQPERVWQDFFEENRWIFGLGLDYRIGSAAFEDRLETVVRGASATTAGFRVDAVLRTRGFVQSLCLVEIKRHDTALLEQDAYRSGAWQVSKELGGGVAQCHASVYSVSEDPSFEVEGVEKVMPRSILVIGRLDEFQRSGRLDKARFRSFEQFRRHLTAPEIITFDELYSRAQASLIRDEELVSRPTEHLASA